MDLLVSHCLSGDILEFKTLRDEEKKIKRRLQGLSKSPFHKLLCYLHELMEGILLLESLFSSYVQQWAEVDRWVASNYVCPSSLSLLA